MLSRVDRPADVAEMAWFGEPVRVTDFTGFASRPDTVWAGEGVGDRPSRRTGDVVSVDSRGRRRASPAPQDRGLAVGGPGVEGRRKRPSALVPWSGHLLGPSPCTRETSVSEGVFDLRPPPTKTPIPAPGVLSSPPSVGGDTLPPSSAPPRKGTSPVRTGTGQAGRGRCSSRVRDTHGRGITPIGACPGGRISGGARWVAR